MEIASFSNLRVNYKPHYNDEEDAFIMENRVTGQIEYVAKSNEAGMYPLIRVKEVIGKMTDETDPSIIHYLHQRLLHASQAVIRKGVQSGFYQDILKGKELTAEDWSSLQNCTECKMWKDGRMKDVERDKDYIIRRPKSKVTKTNETIYSLDKQYQVRLCFDLVYVGNDISLLMVVKPYNYTLQCWIPDRSSNSILKAIEFLVLKVRSSPGVLEILSIQADREPGVRAIEQDILRQLQILLKQAVPYGHERTTERCVRTRRNQLRCVLSELKVPKTRTLRKLAWEHVNSAANFIPNSNSGDFVPFQLHMKEKNFRTPPKFGEFVLTNVDDGTSKEDAKNAVAMIVGFEETTSNVRVKFRDSNHIFERKAFSRMDQEIGIKKYMEQFENYVEIIERDDADAEDVPEYDPFDAIIASETDLVMATSDMIHGLAEDAAKQGPEGQKAAIKIELDRVWKKYEAITPVRLDKETAKEIIKGKLFVVEKKDTAHNFTRNKGRLVARGDMRKDKPKETHDTFSPTVAFPTILTVLNLILKRKWVWTVMDVESAYLNANYADGIYMKLEPRVAKVMVEMDKSVQDKIEPDGSLYVKIEKALYGLQESAKLWYEDLGKTLVSFGFTRSNYDHALYLKKLENGERVLILVYVDDMLAAGPGEELVQLKNELEKVYSISSSPLSPKLFDYVGMKIEYDDKEHAFLLSQPGMVKKVTDGITKVAEIPCDMNLLKSTNAEKYSNVTEYRSKVMEAKYLSKVRPDLSVALGYLTTRMQEPTKGDWEKLLRVREYINGTKEFKMRLKPMDNIQVYASADASFGTFNDGKSNSGIALTVGFPNAPVLAKSTKQKSVANSSTAAELIAFSSTLEEVLWLVRLLEELGFTQAPVTIEQDNTSTMRLIEKGPSSNGRTKWIHVKNFWVSEYLENGEIKLKYVPSLDLLADGLTKPLGRRAFLQWRARILNGPVGAS